MVGGGLLVLWRSGISIQSARTAAGPPDVAPNDRGHELGATFWKIAGAGAAFQAGEAAVDSTTIEGATIVNVVPYWSVGQSNHRIAMKELLYPSNRDVREDPIEARREEMDWNAEQFYKEKLEKAKSTRLIFGLIGLLPFVAGWWFSIGRFVNAPGWLAQLLQ